MAEITDVVEVTVADARPGDWLIDSEGGVVATVRVNNHGVFLVDFGDFFDFHWQTARLNSSRSTVPIPENLRGIYARLADQRLRVKGRFVPKVDEYLLKDFLAML